MKKTLLLVVVAVLLLCALGFRQNSRQVYEYKFVQMKLDFTKTEAALSELGAQGWEVIAINEPGGVINVYLKRAK